MDLTVERLPHCDHQLTEPGIALSLAHYFLQNGDCCKDPELTLMVYPEQQLVKSLTFEMSLPPLYQLIYQSEDHTNQRLEYDINTFLGTWLENLISQEHGLNWSFGVNN